MDKLRMALGLTTAPVVTSALLVLVGAPVSVLDPAVLAQLRPPVVALVGGRVYPSRPRYPLTTRPLSSKAAGSSGSVPALRCEYRQRPESSTVRTRC
jgi:hypothetical protein